MKKMTLCALMASLSPTVAFADANCAHSQSWQCQHAIAGTGPDLSTHPTNVVPPEVPQAGTTTPALGSLPTDHHNVTLKPHPKYPGKTPSALGPPKKGKPITVTGTQTTLTGYGPVPQEVTGTQTGFTGYGPVPQQVTGTQTGFTGYGPVPQQVTGTQTGFSGYGPVPQQVTGTQTGFSGYGPVPQQVPGTQTGFTGYGPVPQPVTGTPSGGPPKQSKPITVTGTQTTITGYGPVPQPVTGTPTGTSGYGKGPQTPSTQKPPLTVQQPYGMSVIVQGAKTPAGTSGHKAPGTVDPTHQLVVHAPLQQKPVTSGHHGAMAGEYNLEFIEPGVQNHKVEVYRSKDAKQAVYDDVNPESGGDFHLTVVGIRNPDYSH